MNDLFQDEIDADRYRKLRRYMGSNVEAGWKVVEQLGAVCAWQGYDKFDLYLDSLPECNVGLSYSKGTDDE